MVMSMTLAAAESPAQKSVHEAALGWTTGAVKQDAEALKRYLADDLQYAHAGGQLQNKEVLAGIKSLLRSCPRQSERERPSPSLMRVSGDWSSTASIHPIPRRFRILSSAR